MKRRKAKAGAKAKLGASSGRRGKSAQKRQAAAGQAVPASIRGAKAGSGQARSASTPAAMSAASLTRVPAGTGAALHAGASSPQPEAKREYIGIYDQSGTLGKVILDDRRELREITILPGSEGGAKQGDRVVAELASEDGQSGSRGHRQGGASSVAAVSGRSGAAGRAGAPGRTGAFGRVTEVLGAGGDLAVAEKALIRRLGLRQSFSDEQLAAADKLNRAVEPREYADRLDLRRELLVTIDGDDTRDIDDAVSLTEEDGKWRLGVHIADVSHYVKEGSLLDREAFARGTSVYFPDLVLPMLPPDLSNGICSLNEGVERLAVSCLMTLNKRGAVTGYEIKPSVIKVRERLTYAQVQGYLNRRQWGTKEALAGRGGGAAGGAAGGASAADSSAVNSSIASNSAAGNNAAERGVAGVVPMTATDSISAPGEAEAADAATGANFAFAAEAGAALTAEVEDPFFRDEAVGPMLLEMAKLCLALRQSRLDRGALDFELPECKIIPGGGGIATEIKRKNRMLSEMIIEELMIAANETVAAHYQRARIPFPYRVHEGPGQDKAAALELMLRSLGLTLRDKTAAGENKKDRGKGAAKGDGKNSGKNAGRSGKGRKNSGAARGAGEAEGAPDVSTVSYKRLLAEVKGRPEESIVSALLLRSMSHATYSVDNRGHFGLASGCYCHFTSPIRRYPDLMVHRMIKKMAADEVREPDGKEALRKKMDEQCQEASIRERIAEDAERKADSLWKADYMSRFIGEEYDGVINGVTDFGFYVSLENTAEGLIHISKLEGYYEYIEEQMTLISRDNPQRYRLGDTVRVVLESVDVSAGYINFRPVQADMKKIASPSKM
ncbi:MAG: RNB domain-containing ribonuclease [Clostridiales bacterium]|nr:RNB domain-containing ribonuclease [Clostridiales bacterium]